MNEKRLLVLGSLEDFVKLTRLAVSKGIYTVVADGYEGDAKKYASKAYTVNLNDKDLVDQIIREEGIDHVISSFSDILFEITADVADRNGLPFFCNPEKARFLRDKILMKEMLSELGIPSEKAQKISASSLDEKDVVVGFPCVVKPLDGWGSKGLSIAHNFEEFRTQVSNNAAFSTDKSSVMLETINMGYEINIMTWIKDGEAYVIELGDRETTGMTKDKLPHQAREIFPTVYYDEVEETAVNYLKKVAEYCGYKEGPLSMQFYYNNGEISVGEVAARFFGYGQGQVPIICGIDPNELLLNAAYWPEKNHNLLMNTGRNVAFNHHTVALYIIPKRGVVKDLGNLYDFNNEHVDEFVPYAEPGIATSHIPWIVRIYAHFDTREEADAYTKDVFDNLYVPDLNGDNLVLKNEMTVHDGKKWHNL